MSKRVAFFADNIAHWNAGTERQLLLLGTELSKRDWSVPLYVLNSSDAVLDGSWPDEVISLDAARVASLTTWWHVLVACRRETKRGTLAVHCFFNDSSIVVPPMSRMAGLPAIVSRRDMGFWYTPTILKILKLIRRSVATVVANCEAVRENVCRFEGFLHESVDVIYNGIAEDELPPRDLTGDRLVIGVVANIRPIKRLEDAIQAFAMVSRKYPTAVLRIVGGGDSSALQQLARDLAVLEYVEFPGQSLSPADEVSRFSIAMLTSESEGLSNAIIEYMLAGVPVLCSDTGGNSELILHNETGLLASVGDTDLLGILLDQLLADGALRDRLGSAARSRVLALCSTDTMVTSHTQLYERVAA
jgi:glycosyltransferase involved in cell wall biosynthesis